MKKIFLLAVLSFLVFEAAHSVGFTTNQPETKTTFDDEYATYYIVIADSGTDYYKLEKEMNSLSKTFDIPIDTMGRSYNKEKNLIALADDDEDEIYAGDYYPRRFPSEFLSLEYLTLYQSKIKNETEGQEKIIAVVAGIYEKKKDADLRLKAIRKQAPQAYVLKAEVYVGCLH